MEYNQQMTESDKRFADEFSTYVNGKMASPRKVGKALINKQFILSAVLKS